MKKVITTFIAILGIVLLVGCRLNADKAELLDWMHSLNEDNIEVYFWSYDMATEQLLSAKDAQTLMSIFAAINIENLTENKELAGSTPEYGLRLVVNEKSYYLIQADAPKGQCEISFHNKQWWIESVELRKFMCSFLKEQK